MMLNSAFLLAFQEGFSADQITWQTLVSLACSSRSAFFARHSGVALGLWKALVSSIHVASRCDDDQFGWHVLSASANADHRECQDHGLPGGTRYRSPRWYFDPTIRSSHLAGGNVMNVMQAIIAANRAGIDLDFDKAAAIDLAGRDVLDAVRTSVHPKVIDCPDPSEAARRLLALLLAMV